MGVGDLCRQRALKAVSVGHPRKGRNALHNVLPATPTGVDVDFRGINVRSVGVALIEICPLQLTLDGSASTRVLQCRLPQSGIVALPTVGIAENAPGAGQLVEAVASNGLFLRWQGDALIWMTSQLLRAKGGFELSEVGARVTAEQLVVVLL